MEENNDIVLAGGDALLYLGEPMHKNYPTTFVWGHSFSTYVSHDRFLNSPPPVRTCTHFWRLPLLSPSCVRTSWMAYFPTKKQITTFEYRIHWNISIRKKKNSLRAISVQRYCTWSPVTLSHINSMIIAHFKSYLSQCF